jgi:hypothetical protein
MKHEMQHPDSPTWCIHCGTFDIYAETTECAAEPTRAFDSRIPGTFDRMLRGVFGDRVPPFKVREAE